MKLRTKIKLTGRDGRSLFSSILSNILLHHAASVSDLQAIDAALDGGASTDKHPDLDGGTPLHLAAASASEHAPKALRKLITAGADVNAVDAVGMTALMHAAKAGLRDNMLVLVEAGANASAVDNRGMNAMAHADGAGVFADIRLHRSMHAASKLINTTSRSAI